MTLFNSDFEDPNGDSTIDLTGLAGMLCTDSFSISLGAGGSDGLFLESDIIDLFSHPVLNGDTANDLDLFLCLFLP